MMLFIALIMGLAVAQKVKKEKVKKKMPVVCNGIEDEDHLMCMKINVEDCEMKVDTCKVGPDRVAGKSMMIKKCMDKSGADISKICESQDDCVCGQQCHLIEWMNKKVCSSCMDAGVKDDCVKMGKMECKWLGDENDGKCIQAKTMCNELGKKECAKSSMGKCAYNKKSKKCSMAFESKCSGIIQGSHGKCYDVDNKVDCMKVVSMFSKPLCKWGFSKYDDLEKDYLKCQKDQNVPIGKVCSAQADCQCGFTCFDNKLWKACSICKDMGIEDDCSSEVGKKMGCVWIAKSGDGEGNGICIRAKHECDAGHFDAEICGKNKMCKYDPNTDKCMKAEVNKATCKMISKKKKGVEMDAAAVKAKCVSIPQCSFNDDKKKCSFRKQK